MSRDPNEAARPTAEFLEFAKSLGLKAVHVICDDRDKKSGSEEGVSFWVATPEFPKANDTIVLENKVRCRILKTLWQVISDNDPVNDGRVHVLIPTIYAIRVSQDDGDSQT